MRERLPALLGVVLAGCMAGLAVTPAAGQTTLLEVDYRNLRRFHVLSDGRILMPLGAAAGYVLTSDSSGYGTWQEAPVGGLSSVSSDATLTGDGTPGDPLGVSVPLALTGTADGIVRGTHADGAFGVLGGVTVGAVGVHADGHSGLLGGDLFGSGGFGAAGLHANGNTGLLGNADYGAYGEHTNGNWGGLGGIFYGAFGENANGHWGQLGNDNSAVFGLNANGNGGSIGSLGTGASGVHANGNFGRLGSSDYGAYGQHSNGNEGSLGGSFFGAFGQNNNNNRGYLGHDEYGLWATGSPWAGYFSGDVHVTGTLSKGGGSFKIDHPLDPENRYLAHSFVESPDMMNVYNGNVTTDARGEAVVELPAYFEALNRDFRYQLTVIGTFAQAIVAEEIQGNRFVISTDRPGVKVSWQVTGIRQDRWANEHRIQVEQEKPAAERGLYLHPRLYGQTEAEGIAGVPDEEEASTDRAAMRRQIEEERAQIEQERRRVQAGRVGVKTDRAPRPPRPRPDHRP